MNLLTMWITTGFLGVGIIADTFKIAGIFRLPEQDTSMEEIMFKISAKLFDNSNDTNTSPQVTLIPFIKKVQSHDAIRTEAHVCSMLNDSVIAIFGPQEKTNIPIVKSISDVKEIPHIQAKYDGHQTRSICGINLYPHPTTLSKAYSDLIRKLGWSSFIILYEDNESLIRISGLLQPQKKLSVEIKQLSPLGNFRDIFRNIIKSEQTNIFLDCTIAILPEVLKQAQQTGMMIAKYNYIVTCLDLHTLDLEQYKYSGVRIFGWRLVNPSKSYVSKILSKIAPHLQEFDINEPEKIQVEAALMFDAVRLFGNTLQEKYLGLTADSSNLKYITDENVPSCFDENSWKYGFSIINDLKVAEMKGLSGLIKFDNEGFRTNIELQIIELKEDGIRGKGLWNSSFGENMTFIDDPPLINEHDFRNLTLKIIIPMTKPFGMRKPSPAPLSGNERFEGYAVDLARELSLLFNFKYDLLIQEDGSNGIKTKLENGTEVWDGMMGAVLNGTADLAIGDVTVTNERSQYVMFTSPFMNLGISILFTQPKKENPSLFSFLFPFSDAVWVLVITACIGMSLQLYVMARISPYEWINPYPCIQDPEELENQFTFSNSLWFTIGALMQQGSDVAPISPCTRIAAGVWWFFTLIMVSSYTANLAAFLTVENEVSPFSDAAELARQDKIAFGAKKKGTTFSFFKESPNPVYKQIYEYMASHPENMVTGNEEGVKKVLESNDQYAFFMESTAIEYEKEQHCELAQIGSLLDSKTYAIAMRKREWYFDDLTAAILLLQEKGTLTALKRKWWKEKYSKNCQQDKKNDAQTLKLGNVGGVFLVLIAGVVIGCLLMLYEMISNIKNTTKDEKVPLKQELVRELKFIVKCKSVKPVHKPDEKSLLGSHSETNN